MKLKLILFFLIPFSLFADVPIEQGPSGHFGKEQIFTEKGELPIPEKGYNKPRCFKAFKLMRNIINRLRTLSFRIDKKCRKVYSSVSKDDCNREFSNMKTVLETFNRQREIVNNTCVIN